MFIRHLCQIKFSLNADCEWMLLINYSLKYFSQCFGIHLSSEFEFAIKFYGRQLSYCAANDTKRKGKCQSFCADAVVVYTDYFLKGLILIDNDCGTGWWMNRRFQNEHVTLVKTTFYTKKNARCLKSMKIFGFEFIMLDLFIHII